jgi:hypothetical protein
LLSKRSDERKREERKKKYGRRVRSEFVAAFGTVASEDVRGASDATF